MTQALQLGSMVMASTARGSFCTEGISATGLFLTPPLPLFPPLPPRNTLISFPVFVYLFFSASMALRAVVVRRSVSPPQSFSLSNLSGPSSFPLAMHHSAASSWAMLSCPPIY